MELIINNLEEMNAFALKISTYCGKNVNILLAGDLGAGKTTFTKMLLKHLGVTKMVNSPTFVILNQYEVNDLTINHMDAYRLQNSNENDMYIELFKNSLNIIEWYNNLCVSYLGKIIKVSIEIIDDNVRKIILEK